MLSKILESKGINIFDDSDREHVVVEQISRRDIAIIGISGKFPKGDNVTEFWNILKEGKDCIRDFPEKRKSDVKMFTSHYSERGNIKYFKGGFLDEIDKFDYKLFSLSRKEANLIDPNQRLFLQESWNAIGDAGYDPIKLAGGRIGVYVGFSSDFGEEYKRLIESQSPSLLNISVPGNIKSIIGSRISYLFNFTGPSMVIDTACASSLVAVHLACQGIRNGDCEMAVAGGVKIHLSPVCSENGEGIGIESQDNRTRTFSEDSDGTGFGEGAATIVLKPLNKAMEDSDHIYAVIKGTAINQDGKSVGITAPNSRAQTDVITKAWRDAEIDPETISYIEAHGTATRLGDTVEIEGIEEAFSQFTKRKQFCAIGSVKTNIGHLDNAAGIVGLIKIILALKHKEIPPSINFNSPNKKISFETSPVYVNDRCLQWKSEGVARRCGISSFGLSGTNCHIVLEEAPEYCNSSKVISNNSNYVYTLSARTPDQLKEQIKKHVSYLKNNSDQKLKDICYTLNTGRTFFQARMAFITMNETDCIRKLEKLVLQEMKYQVDEGVFVGEHKLVPDIKDSRDAIDLSESEKQKLNLSARQELERFFNADEDKSEILKRLCGLFVQGADVDWQKLYLNQDCKRVSLPVYPLESSRCWVDSIDGDTYSTTESEEGLHKLVDKCLAMSMDRQTYSTLFSVDRQWVLSDHIVNGNYVIPGTTYLEMVRAIAAMNYGTDSIEISNMVFLTPFIANPGETREIQTIFNTDGHENTFTIISQDSENNWIRHVEGSCVTNEEDSQDMFMLDDVINRCVTVQRMDKALKQDGIMQLGARWDCIKDVYMGNGEVVVSLKLPEEFHHEIYEYGFHPSLMDCAVNLAIDDYDGSYLPFSYRSIKMYGKLPGEIYSYIKSYQSSVSSETKTFDILLMDCKGKILCAITGYTIKKVHLDELEYGRLSRKNDLFFSFKWNRVERELFDSKKIPHKCIAVFGDGVGVNELLNTTLIENNMRVIYADIGENFRQVSDDVFETGNSSEDYNKLIDEFEKRGVTLIIHMSSIIAHPDMGDLDEVNYGLHQGIYSLFYLTKSILRSGLRKKIGITVISQNVYEITCKEKSINALGAALFGMAQTIPQEYDRINCRCIDIGDEIKENVLVSELFADTQENLVAYRDNERYTKKLHKQDIEKSREHTIEIKNTGVYIITGGLGDIGLEIAKYLATKNKVNLCLINRTGLPERETWDLFLESDKDIRICNCVKTIMALEKKGSTVKVYSADIADLKRIEAIVSELKSDFGRINGMFHCAGVAGNGFIINKDIDTFQNVIGPKIQGTWVLDYATREEQLDFFVLFSSINSFLGGAGQSDYSAANAFLDSYAVKRSKTKRDTIVINWTAWKDIGMAVKHNMDINRGFFKPIPTGTALRALDHIFEKDVNNVLIGQLNADAFSEQEDLWSRFFSKKLKNIILSNMNRINPLKQDRNTQQRIAVILRGKDEKDINRTESIIARIWANVLCLDSIDIYDSFYDMGGDSLLAVQLFKEMEKEFPGFLDITDVFEHSSVYLMSKYINSTNLQSNDSASDELDAILTQLAKGEITVNDIDDKIK